MRFFSGTDAPIFYAAADGHVAGVDAPPSAILARTDAVAAVAADHAEDVDRAGRFPREAIAAAREAGLFGLMVPRELGGEGARVSEIANICYRLGRACSSTAMIYAMHQACLACLVRHGHRSPWHRGLLRRAAAEQLLFASSTTEGKAGGSVRTSAAAVVHEAAGITLHRQATVVSYGAEADGIVTTARRTADSAPSDQVLIAFLKEGYTLETLHGWDALGMRGTCSGGFALHASGHADQIVGDGYDKIHTQTMVPVSHVTWAAVWAGIAAGAVSRAKAFVRQAARENGGTVPPGAAHLTAALASLRNLRGLVATALDTYERNADDERALASLDFQFMINMTKVDASELAVATVMSAGRACGLSGYRNDSRYSIGRHLRDVLSSPIMISNDRIRTNVAGASLLTPDPMSLTD